MATFPKDRFDSVPDDLLRTGAHRGPKRPGSGWIAFAWAALATGILVVLGLLGLAVINGKLDLPFSTISESPSPSVTVTPTPTVSPKIDPSLEITILNGTNTTGLAGSTGDYLVTKGWAGASADAGTRTNASTKDIKTTVVYYNLAANEAAAKAMVESLGVGTIELSTAYADSPITVVLGADFTLPAG
jgi:hypothetical protein